MNALEQDRLKLSLTRFIESVMPNFDFYAVHPGRVVAPGPVAGTFDFQPNNPRMPALQSVPLRSGIPGVSVSLLPGAAPSCLLCFEEHSPMAPYLALWGAGPGLAGFSLQAAETINLDAPLVALGPAWLTFVSGLTGASDPAVKAAASTLLALLNAVH